jgi:biofilm protein TabA
MVYQCSEGVYVFPFASDLDGSAAGDQWYETVSDADSAASEAYGVVAADWRLVPDPAPGAQHDWVAPVRVAGRDAGSPQWGCFERLVHGEWVGFDPKSTTWSVEAAIQQWHQPDSRTLD